MTIIFTLTLFQILFSTQPLFAAKGLRTEEIGNTEKRLIAETARKIRDNPDDGDIAFASSLKLIEINHVRAFDKLKELYEKGPEVVRAKIIKAIGQQRDNGVTDAADEYWRILSQALEATSKVISREVVISLALLENEEFFDKLLEKLKSKDSSRTAVDNIVKVFCMFKLGPSRSTILVTGTIGTRVEALKLLAARGDQANKESLAKALGKKFGEDFSDLKELEKWWLENQNKGVAQIFEEANEKNRLRVEQERKRAEKYRLKSIEKTIENFKNILASDEKKAVALLQRELSDPEAEPEVLVFVIGELGRRKVKEALGRLRELLESRDLRVRIAAIEAISEVGDQEVVGEVARKLSADSSQERLASVNTVSRLGGELAAAKLLGRLEQEKDRSVLSAIILGLGHVGMPSALKPLVGFVAQRTGTNLKLRETIANNFIKDVANALGDILVSGRNSGDGDRALAIKCLMKMLDVENDAVKFAAIDNLGNAGAEKAIAILVDVLNKNPNSGIRARAGRALGKMITADSSAVNALFAHLSDKDTFVAKDCMTSLRNIAGLNGSRRQVDLDLLLRLTSRVQTANTWEIIRSLLKNLPEEKIAKQPGWGNVRKLYRLKARLAEAHMEADDYKSASAELEKVVAYEKWTQAELLKQREMLAEAYEAQGLLTKANDEFDRLIKMVRPPQAERFWKEKLKLIEGIEDIQEKIKWVNAELRKAPPTSIRQKLEHLKRESAEKISREPRTP